MEDITQVVVPKKRPTFITVLCILSLIGSGFDVFGNLMTMSWMIKYKQKSYQLN